MQEELGESDHRASRALVWPCPLCQQDRMDRDALAQHLTDKHSVLPACLDRLLDTATPVHHGIGREVEETDTDNNTADVVSSKQMLSESNGAPSDPSETEVNSAGIKRGNANTWVLKGSRTKVMDCPEKHTEGEQEGVKDNLDCDEDRPPDPESTKTLKCTPKRAVRDTTSDTMSITNTTTSKSTNDPVMDKFLDPNRPFKCNACLESFTSKSALGVHYSSATHLQRMRTGSGKQGDENETLSSPSSAAAAVAAAQPLSRPFISNKPYQCAVCRVSYNHAFTLESHMKSVLHQTRSRNAIHNVSGNSDKKGTVNSGNTIPTSAVNTPNPVAGSVVNPAHCGSASTSTTSIQGGSNSSTGATKDTEQSQLQNLPSACSPSAPALSLLSSPVASPQAMSAFLALLTSNSHSMTPPLQSSLFTTNTSTPPGTSNPQLELITQQQLLMPLFLNGLQTQTQNQNSNVDSPSSVLGQSVSLLGLSAAQQAVLAQRLSSMQNQTSGLLGGLATVMRTNAGLNEREGTTNVVEQANQGVEEKVETSQGKEKEVNKPLNPQSQADEREVVENVKAYESSVERSVSGCDGTLSDELTRQAQVSMHSSVKGEMGSDGSFDHSKFEQRAVEKTEKAREASQTIHDEVDKLKCSKSPERCTKMSLLCDSSCFTDDTSLSSNTKPSLKFFPKETTRKPNSSPDQDQNTKFTNCIHASLRCNSSSNSGGPSLIQNDNAPFSAVSKMKRSSPRSGHPVLSEFQSQVLWAFLESRSDADAVSPPREDCEALGREVGLDEAVVRRWLEDAREARERERNSSGKAASTEANKAFDEDEEEEEGALTIVETEEGESPTTSSHAIDLSHSGGRVSPGESGLTSDSDNDGYYTSFIVTDEESQNDSVKEEAGTPMKEEAQREEKVSGGGKVLRSSTVFLSDAEDSEEEEGSGNHKAKKRKRREVEEVEVKKERLDPDVDLELEAQADPPPLSISAEQQGIPSITTSSNLQTLPLSLSLGPFSTQFLNPYVLSLHPSAVGLGMAEGDRERDRGRPSAFQNPPASTRCSAPFMNSLKGPPPASHMSPAKSLSNGGICESALDLSIGKKQSSTSACVSSSTGEKAVVQRDHTVDGVGIRPAALGVPGGGGLIVVRVKPESAVAFPTSNSNANSNNNVRTSTVYIRAAERLNASRMEKEKEKVQVKETENEKQQKQTKARRYRDMRRSRTIIQTEQLDVLYGCYFKDPNPGKHEFERISEWVHLPKKVVQIWFQNMRARERKGEVRFISDGTLAAVGKPLIKFTWPLTLPIFSSSPSPNTSTPCSGGITKVSAGASPVAAPSKGKMEKVQEKEKEKSMPKEAGAAASLSLLTVPKSKPESQVQVAMPKPATKVVAAAPAVPIMVMKSCSSPASFTSQKRKRNKEEERGEEEEKTDEEEEDHGTEKVGPGSTNRMVPKLTPALTVKPPASGSHKHNGLNDWSAKGTFKINTLTREQLGLSSTSSSVSSATAASTPHNSSSTTKSSPQEGAYPHHSTPRRPRTHLTSLQVSIMQSCYETCPHPNALECETVGTELGLPLKVVQIWFQNTRAKEKRWRLQMQKQSPNATDSSKKVDTSSGSFLLYNALRANRPILPKPVQLTVLEPSAPPGLGQPAGRETLRGRCEACGVDFESRAAGRTHVFSPQHLATLRSTNFGQPPSLVNKSSGTGSTSSSAVAVQSSSSSASTTS
ncbi:zinc finger homeobox protein 3-like [Arapaima gigas]